MIELKSQREIEIMSRAGKVAALLLKELEQVIRPGMRTIELDEIANRFICSRGCQPAFKGYKGYPCAICASVNEEVVHAVPGQKRLKEGMVLAIEPMVTEGDYEVEIHEDGWTAVTKDRKLAAHFEHTVAITAEGPRILTQ